MAEYHINLFYSKEDSGYVADIPDLESCSAFGKTPGEALAEVQRAKAGWRRRASFASPLHALDTAQQSIKRPVSSTMEGWPSGLWRQS